MKSEPDEESAGKSGDAGSQTMSAAVRVVTWLVLPGIASAQWVNCAGTSSATCAYYGNNVGIGTTVPSSALDVNCQVVIDQKNFGGQAGLLVKGLYPDGNWPTIGLSLVNTSGIDVQSAARGDLWADYREQFRGGGDEPAFHDRGRGNDEREDRRLSSG